MATAKRTGVTNVSNEADQSPRPAKRQRISFYYDPSPELDQDERGNSTADNYSNNEYNSTKSDKDNRPRPATRQRPSPSCDGPLLLKRKHYSQ